MLDVAELGTNVETKKDCGEGASNYEKEIEKVLLCVLINETGNVIS